MGQSKGKRGFQAKVGRKSAWPTRKGKRFVVIGEETTDLEHLAKEASIMEGVIEVIPDHGRDSAPEGGWRKLLVQLAMLFSP